MRERARVVILTAMLAAAGAGVASQAAPFRIVSAGPRGELAEIEDADQIRIAFSEPMIAIGTAPPETAPSWIHVTPQIAGAYYWSGTKTLILSPSAELPYGTTFTVRVDAAATSLAGRALGAPYEFTFSTPPQKLISTSWYRRNGRLDGPVVIALRFKQPVRPDDIVAHTQVKLQAHDWMPPVLSTEARAYLRRVDPGGLRRFDAKVALVRQVAAAAGVVPVRLARSWDEERFVPGSDLVVIETEGAPSLDAWLRIETAGGQSGTIVLEPTFFVAGARCQSMCSPGANTIRLTRYVETGAFARALTISDVTNAGRERPVTAARNMSEENATGATFLPTVTDAGFDAQPLHRTWRLRLAEDLRATDGQTLGYPWVEFVDNQDPQPSFLAFGGSVLEAGAGSDVPFSTRNVQSIRQSLAAVAPDGIMKRLWALEDRHLPPPDADGKTRSLDVTPDVVQPHTLDLRRLLSPQGTGLVWADVRIEQDLPHYSTRGGVTSLNEIVTAWTPRVQRSLLQITNLGITVKYSAKSALVFVTRLDTGEPVVNADVTLVAGNDEPLWHGTTDGGGVAFAPALALQSTTRWAPSFLVMAEKDGDVAFVPSNWEGERYYNWNDPHQAHWNPGLRGTVFTDRGVYKPDEEIHIKAVLREDTPKGPQNLTAGSELAVVIRDARDREVDRRRVAVSQWGSAEWTWRAPADASFGYYDIHVSRAAATATAAAPDEDNDKDEAGEEAVTGRFRVATFRRPDFRVDTALASETRILGTPLRATVNASYLFGAALASRPVKWAYSRTPVVRPPDAVRERYPAERYEIGYVSEKGDTQKAEEQTLGADGSLTVTIPTDSGDDQAFAYLFEADVEGESRQHIANRTSLVVHPSSIYLAVSRPPRFADPARGVRVGVAAVDLSGRTVPGVDVTTSLVKVEWVSVRKQAPAEGVDWVRREVPAGQWTLRTAGTDTALSVPVSDAGLYILRAIARDGEGRQTRTETDFYVIGTGPASWLTSGNRINLVPERVAWKPGESARVLIQSPWPKANALLTVEREGIRTYRELTVNSTQDVVEVPITQADVPNVYVSVVLVKGRTADAGPPEYLVGYTELSVDDGSTRLGVRVAADRAEYQPGDPVKVSVSVDGPGGTTASSEVTLWAVDQGLLTLTGYTTPDLVKAIYVPKTLDVMTADNRRSLVDRGWVARDSYGGADGVSSGVVSDLVQTQTAASMNVRSRDQESVVDGVRRDFRPLVFWLGSATTDGEGRVTTTVTLPESLTTYRIMAVAADETRFGFGEHDVRVTKPLTLLPAFPRFLNAGDRAAIGVVVTNAGSRDGTAEITIQSLDPGTLRFTETRQAVHLAAGASQSVAFSANAVAAGQARVRLAATLGNETDAMEMPIAVTRPSEHTTTAAYGETTSAATTERLVLPPNVQADAGGLTLGLASTALVGLSESAQYLNEYPYECVEQKASRALALLLASDLGDAFALPRLKPADYRPVATNLLRDLASQQCPYGGFALWPGSCAGRSAYLTAYVLHVMKTARTLQVGVDDKVVEAALDFLEQQEREPRPASPWWPVWAVSQAYVAKVLAEFGRKPEGIDALVAAADRLPLVALSHLADALAASGNKGRDYQDLVRRLTNALRIDADRAHVEEPDGDQLGWLWNTNVTSTAVALEGFARRKDNMALAAPLARGLVAAQTNGRWGTTHENALALEALAAYYRVFEGDVPHMTARVSVNSAPIGSATFEGRSTEVQQIRVPMPDLLKQAANATSPELSISRTGTGRLYYTARVDTFTPVPAVASDRGYRLERRYERFVKNATGAAATSFAAGDLIRVTLTLTVRGEARYLALTDPLPAGFEPLEDWALTTASDLAAEATRTDGDNDWWSWWRGGYFDHVEKRDDRVLVFATRLGSGRHEFSYLVRATTAGTFDVPGARAESMYAPEVSGRSAAATVTVR